MKIIHYEVFPKDFNHRHYLNYSLFWIIDYFKLSSGFQLVSSLFEANEFNADLLWSSNEKNDLILG